MLFASQTEASSRSARPLGPVGLSALLLVLSLALVWRAGEWGRGVALSELRRGAEASLTLHVAALRSELEKYRAVASVLAWDTDVAAVLAAPSDPGAVDRMNRKLEALSKGTHAAVLYVLDASGKAIAASNWRLTTSFVGQDYAFRRYHRAALAQGTGEQFAAGTVSQRPGYYLARRTETGATGVPAFGVVVLKVEFEEMEAGWRRGRGHTFVSDAEGVVLIADAPEWRFTTLRRLPEAVRDRLRDDMQYGATATLAPLPLARPEASGPDGGIVRLLDRGGGADALFLEAAAPVPDTSWVVHFLEALEPSAGRGRLSAMTIAGLSASAVACLVVLAVHRRGRVRHRMAEQARVRDELERRVAERTGALSRSNARLREEVEERRRAEVELRRTQDELVHAARLAALGQMGASIAHEVNQPLAAMRAYSDNAAVLLARGRVQDVEANLSSISSLTERIAHTTNHLKAFARKTSGGLGPVSVQAAIAAATALLGHRTRRQGVRVSVQVPEADLRVHAEQVRLEQVLVNLLQNALDALAGTPNPEIAIGAHDATGERVAITVSDNGPGIPDEALPRVFSAFFTTKGDGLGLGLAISRGIVQEFGGTLVCTSRPGTGSTFTICLRAIGPGTVGPGAVGSGAVGPGAVGSGAVGSGTVGPGATR